MNIKELKRIITEKLKEDIAYRDKTRGTGVFLAENIGAYYASVGRILILQNIGSLIGMNKKLLDYTPFETAEDDEKFNYCGAISEIGRKDGE